MLSIQQMRDLVRNYHENNEWLTETPDGNVCQICGAHECECLCDERNRFIFEVKRHLRNLETVEE